MDIVTEAIGGIISKLADLLKSEYMLQTGVKGQVESLTMELKSAYAFLQEIDKVPPDQLNKQVKIWADEVREASYDMDDVLDSFLVHVMGVKPTNKKQVEWLWEKMASLFSKIKARHDIANAIEEVYKKVKEIHERRRRYKLDDQLASPATPSSIIDPRIAEVHRTKASLLIGIEERKDAVIRMLSQLDDMSAKKKKVVSLLGFGGVGKTTLAKAIYDQLKDEYHCGAFVSVGQKPNMEKVLKDILYYLDQDKFRHIHSTQRGADLLTRESLDFLIDKRYLVVIDDIWETQSRKRILEALAENNFGSKIILTTRKAQVATGEVYKVKPLSEDNSKRLFYTRIFGAEHKFHDNQREMVSKLVEKILKKCSGVPLALITMASLLVDKTMEEWYDVCNTIGFRDIDREQTNDTEWILSLSYYDLPSHLKTCLLYLSVFPEDQLISKYTLIWMWIAEGFVDSGKEGTGLFEIGEGYFSELINRSLIQPVEEQDSMIVEGCRVHDMILDLIRSLSREANFAMVLDTGDGTSTGSNVARRLALQNRVVEDTLQGNCTDTARARSFIAFSCRFVPQVQVERFKLLRVLYLDGSGYTKFDKHVGDLHHLRCLGIVRLYIHLELPKEIGELKFLRVLYLGVYGLLPSSVGMLTQLVCLSAPRMDLPNGVIKDLTLLQELRISKPGPDHKSIGQFVEDLRNLSELRMLDMSVRDMDERMQSDLLTSVGGLHKLQHLELGTRGDNKGLRSCIHSSHLPNRITCLTLNVLSLSDQGLQIIGGLPELYYLWLCTPQGRATLSGTTTAGGGYFPKLRSCELIASTCQFLVNEDGSSVSFTLWDGTRNGAPTFGTKKKLLLGSCCSVVASAVMPNLEALYFTVDAPGLTACSNGSCDNLGLEYLASLQKVTAHFTYSYDADYEAKGEREKAALRHAIQVHPNRPTLKIKLPWS